MKSLPFQENVSPPWNPDQNVSRLLIAHANVMWWSQDTPFQGNWWVDSYQFIISNRGLVRCQRLQLYWHVELLQMCRVYAKKSRILRNVSGIRNKKSRILHLFSRVFFTAAGTWLWEPWHRIQNAKSVLGRSTLICLGIKLHSLTFSTLACFSGIFLHQGWDLHFSDPYHVIFFFSLRVAIILSPFKDFRKDWRGAFYINLRSSWNWSVDCQLESRSKISHVMID